MKQARQARINGQAHVLSLCHINGLNISDNKFLLSSCKKVDQENFKHNLHNNTYIQN